MIKLSWEPVRDGKRYCAPACGRGCTRAEYDTAVQKGTELAKRLGEGWECEVWENLGWHYKATKLNCSVHQNGSRRYWADLNFADHQFHATATTPKAAVSTALEEAKAFAFFLMEDIEEFEK